MMANSFSHRWGILDDDQDERMRKYINRLLTLVGERHDATWSNLKVFAFTSGRTVEEFGKGSQFGSDTWFEAGRYFRLAESTPELARRIEDLLNSPILTARNKGLIVNLTNQSRIGIHIVSESDNYLTYPEGEPMLDKEVVERALESLGSASGREYAKALKAYQDGDWEKAAEKTRRTLEEYLREYLSNTAGLLRNIQNISKNLKDNNHATEPLRNSINSQLLALDKQYNESSKHWSKTDGYIEAEYLVYQSGVLINTLCRLKARAKEE